MPSKLTSFNAVGSEQTFSIPEFVDLVRLKVYGAGGADGSTEEGARGLGANGGYAQGDTNVTPGETLYLYVGSAGTTGGDGGGGWPNGGGGAKLKEDGTNFSAANVDAGGGGGSSDVRQNGNTLSDQIILAGGGGGGGNAVTHGGDNNDRDAGDGGSGGAVANDGGSASASVSGDGSSATANASSGTGGGSGGFNANSGDTSKNTGPGNAAAAGGGGGGGQNGGGGGGADTSSFSTANSDGMAAAAAGGGGGDGLTSGLSNTTTSTGGGNSGNGEIKVIYADRINDLTVDSSVEGEVALSWTEPIDVTSIDIYRAEAPGDSPNDYTEIATGLSATTTSYTDTGLEDGEEYYYRVENVNDFDDRLSNEQSGVTPLPESTNLNGSFDGTDVTLTWTNNDNSPDGGIEIERSTDNGSTWTSIATSLAVSTESYTDTTIQPGETVLYRVRRNTNDTTAVSVTEKVIVAGSVVIGDANGLRTTNNAVVSTE